jgi:hypothetical protein
MSSFLHNLLAFVRPAERVVVSCTGFCSPAAETTIYLVPFDIHLPGKICWLLFIWLNLLLLSQHETTLLISSFLGNLLDFFSQLNLLLLSRVLACDHWLLRQQQMPFELHLAGQSIALCSAR